MTNAAMRQKNLWVKSGDFFFKYRNAVFPVLLGTLFVSFSPPAQYFGEESLEEWKDVLAICIALSGLVFRAVVIGFAYIKRGGVNKRVYAENLVTQGFFGLCRNPIYVGNMVIYSGVFLMHGSPYVFLIGVAIYFLIYSNIIAAEEFFLREKFGAAYEAYCRDVPRWIPDLSRFKEAIEGLPFNFKRVFVKDYSTASNVMIALLLLELLGTYRNESAAEFDQQLSYLMVALALILAVTGIIALAKRHKWLRL